MRIRLALFLILLAPAFAWAQTAVPPVPPVPPTRASAAEARTALEVLRDDTRRAELIAVLDAIAKAGATAGPTAVAEPAGDKAADAKPTLPLAPDSLGAQLVTQAADAVAGTGAQLLASARAVNDLPLLWRWVVAQLSDADARARLLDAAWRLLVVLAAGLVAEQGVRVVLLRLRGAVVRGAQASPQPAPPPDPMALPPVDAGHETGLAAAEAGETERSARQWRLTRALGALRKLPFLLGRLALDLVPVVAFALVGQALAGTALGQAGVEGGPAGAVPRVIGIAVASYAAVRAVLVVADMLVSPASPRLRLLHVSDWAAGFLTRWLRRVLVVGVAGYAVAEFGLAFGMYRTAYDALLKLFALAVHLCLVVAILQAREPVARRLHVRAKRGFGRRRSTGSARSGTWWPSSSWWRCGWCGRPSCATAMCGWCISRC